jgi:hypothetical protein
MAPGENGVLNLDDRREKHEEKNGETLVGVKKLKGMLQVNIPAKYAVPAFMALVGLGGTTQVQAWKNGVDEHMKAAAAGYGRLEAVETMAKDLGERMERMERSQLEQWYRDAFRANDEVWMVYLETQAPELRALRFRLRSLERGRRRDGESN